VRWSYRSTVEELVTIVQKLSMARDLETVMSIVRVAARELTGADGATFVLRDRDQCFYAEENAIGPLWKGRRFPMDACISGWSMLHRQAAAIEDIYKDARIPADAYRPTFVHSLVMVPIRTLDPIGAIGNYWARRHRPTAEQIKLLQALADTTAVALENVRVYGELEQRVRDRTAALEVVNNELRTEVTERRKAEAEVRRLSLTDDLTGLSNRRGFFLLAEQQLYLARRTSTPACLVFADVDGLKHVNDTYGHDVGDAMLCDVSELLKKTFRHADVVARFGGDEFAVFAVTPSGSADEIRARLQREMEVFNATCAHRYTLSMSIGVVPCDTDGKEPLEALVGRADAAMYEQKRAKKGDAVALPH
jgi:diguanylate cyclase (GGDEF)-like protein